MKGSDLAREGARIARVELQFSTDLPADLASAALLVYITRPKVSDRQRCSRWRTVFPLWPAELADFRRSSSNCENGILTDNEPAAIAAAIRRALILQERLSANARRCIEEQFSAKNMIEKTMEDYGRVFRC